MMDLAPRPAAELDRIIRHNLAAFVEVGEALAELKESRGYVDLGYRTFADYCAALGLGRAHAYRLIDAAQVTALLSPTGDTPMNERQARELAPLLRAGPSEVQAAWVKAQEVSGGTPTAETVRAVVKEHQRTRRALHVVAAPPADPAAAVTLYRGDCRQVLPTLPADCVQLALTSPPYNCGFSYADNGEADSLPLADYQALLADALAGIYRVLQPGGVLALNLPPSIRTAEHRAWPLAAWAHIHLAAGPWLLREPYAWVKGPDGEAYAVGTRVGAASNPYARPCHELIIVASKASYSIEGKTWENGTPMDILKDVWHIPPASLPRGSGLPQPFPDELARRVVDLYSRAGDIVLDPFAGLGTVAKVARDMGRSAWLIERESAYWPSLAALAGQLADGHAATC